jgi:phosphoglycolate phosphatase
VTGRSIEQIITGTRHLLLDFDGPVCSIFAGIGAANVARQLRDTLTTAGISLPEDAQHTDDPLEVFRLAAEVQGWPPSGRDPASGNPGTA